MKTLIKILVLGSVLSPSLTEAVGISDVKSVVNNVSFTKSSLDSRYEAKDRVLLESAALESRKMRLEQVTGADEVFRHIEVTTETVSLNFKF